MHQFFVLHAVAILLHSACAMYAFLSPVGHKTAFDIRLPLVNFQNLTIEHPYFSDVSGVDFHIPSIVFIHGVVAVVTVLFHAFLYVPLHFGCPQTIWFVRRSLWVRWVEYAITCTLMTLANDMSNGTDNFNQLMIISFAGIALQFIGGVIEQLKGLGRRISITLFVVGSIVEFSISWPIFWANVSASGTTVLQWVETLVFLFYYSLFAINNLYDALHRPNCFIVTDWFYNILSLTSKIALFWLQVGSVDRVFFANAWPNVQIYGLGIALPTIILAAGIALRPPCHLIVVDRWKAGLYHRIATFSLLDDRMFRPRTKVYSRTRETLRTGRTTKRTRSA